MDNPGADQKKMRSVRAFSLFLLAAAAAVLLARGPARRRRAGELIKMQGGGCKGP